MSKNGIYHFISPHNQLWREYHPEKTEAGLYPYEKSIFIQFSLDCLQTDTSVMQTQWRSVQNGVRNRPQNMLKLQKKHVLRCRAGSKCVGNVVDKVCNPNAISCESDISNGVKVDSILINFLRCVLGSKSLFWSMRRFFNFH